MTADRADQILSLRSVVEGVTYQVCRSRNLSDNLRDDLISAGWEAAIRCVDRYDPNNEPRATLRSYARDRIYYAMVDEMRAQSGVRTRITDSFTGYECSVCGTNVALDENGRWQHQNEADHEPQVVEAGKPLERRRVHEISLEAIFEFVDPPELSNDYRSVEDRVLLSRVLPRLSPLHRKVLTDYYLNGRFMSDMAAERGISESAVSHTIKRALFQAYILMTGRRRNDDQTPTGRQHKPRDLCPAGVHYLSQARQAPVNGRRQCGECAKQRYAERYQQMLAQESQDVRRYPDKAMRERVQTARLAASVRADALPLHS